MNRSGSRKEIEKVLENPVLYEVDLKYGANTHDLQYLSSSQAYGAYSKFDKKWII